MFHRFRQNGPKPRLPIGERVYAIGDVHGEARLLRRLLDRIEADNRARDPARVTLLLLGDVIDRGTGSAALLGTMHRLSSRSFVLLKGNHEHLLVAASRGDEDALDLWLRVGGRATLIGFGLDPEVIDRADPLVLIAAIKGAIGPALIDWVDRLPTAWSAGDYFFAHAGIRPGVALDRQSDGDLMWMRDPFLASRADHGKVVVHGHSVQPGVPRLGGNRIGLDTGAHEHGRLTALGLDGDQQWLLQECAADSEPAVSFARAPAFA